MPFESRSAKPVSSLQLADPTLATTPPSVPLAPAAGPLDGVRPADSRDDLVGDALVRQRLVPDLVAVGPVGNHCLHLHPGGFGAGDRRTQGCLLYTSPSPR